MTDAWWQGDLFGLYRPDPGFPGTAFEVPYHTGTRDIENPGGILFF